MLIHPKYDQQIFLNFIEQDIATSLIATKTRKNGFLKGNIVINFRVDKNGNLNYSAHDEQVLATIQQTITYKTAYT